MDIAKFPPLFWYVNFLLAGVLSPKSTSLCHCLYSIRFLIPLIFFARALIDYGDLVVNFQAVDAKTSKIIGFFSYIESQLNLNYAVISFVVFIFRAENISIAFNQLENLRVLCRKAGLTGQSRTYTKVVWLAYVFFNVFSIFNYLFFLLTDFFKADGMEFYLVWKMPARFSHLITQTDYFVCEMFIYPINLLFLLSVADLTQEITSFREKLEKIFSDLLLNPNSLRSEELQQHLKLEEAFVETLNAFNNGFYLLAASFIFGKLLLIFCYIASLFLVMGGVENKNPIKILTYAINCSLLLSFIHVCCINLQETFERNKYLWIRILQCKQQNESVEEDPLNSPERDKWQQQLTAIAMRNQALTVANTANINRGFATTLLTSFVGLLCYFLDKTNTCPVKITNTTDLFLNSTEHDLLYHNISKM